MHDTALQFVIYGILLSGALLLLRRIYYARKTKTDHAILFPVVGFILICSILLIYVFMNAPPLSLGRKAWYKESPAAEILLFSSMLMGMIASYLTKQIERRRALIDEKGRAGDKSPTRLEFDIWEFTYPMLVSVITFGAVLQSLGTKELDLPSVILSFQTGFFWQTVLSRSTPKPVS